jgi:flagellar basal-body rod modification protein FlgD
MPKASSGDVVVTIESSTGELIRTMNIGKQNPGNNNFSWDGKDADGNMMKEGNYAIKARGTVDGEKQDLAVSSYSHVASVNLGNSSNGVILNLRGLGNIGLKEVLAVADS